jgi:peptide/nickel transport system permease protein
MITRRYLVVRSSYAIVTALVAITLNFLLPRIIPGNPAAVILFANYHYLPPGKVKLLDAEFGLTSHNLGIEYIDYLKQLFLHFNLGISFSQYPNTVAHLIETHLPWTLYLLGVSTLLSSVLGVIFGRWIGWRAGSRGESVTSSVFIGLTSLPYFWLAIIFILVFAFMIPIFPLGGSFSITVSSSDTLAFLGSIITHSLLPIITIVITTFPAFALTMRNTMVNQNKEDYLLMARAKGLPMHVIEKRYAGRNAILPVTTHIVLAFGYIVSGAFFVEVVFSYQGIGYLLYQAVTSYDYPLVDGIFLMITITVIIANFLADLLYALLDPRVELR